MDDVVRTIPYYSRRGQELILVLEALWNLGGRVRKRETISFINSSGWFDLSRSDLPPYAGHSEPRYHTLLAWARKDGTLREWVFNDERDSWGITREGRDVLDRSKAHFRAQTWAVSMCFLWTPKFKRIIDPLYSPSDADLRNPKENETKWLGII